MYEENDNLKLETLGRYSRPKNSDYIPDGENAFHVRTEEILFNCKVSRDEVDRWNSNRWLSFKAEDLPNEMDWSDYRVKEIIFIMDLARSGLSDVQINHLLESLEKPYSYPPKEIAYSFRHGWLVPTNEDKLIEDNLEDWLDGKTKKNLLRVKGIVDRMLEEGNCLRKYHPAQWEG